MLRAEPAGRAPGLCLVAMAWYTLRLAPRTSTGARRLVARASGALVLALGALHGAGAVVVAAVDLRAPTWLASGPRELAAGALVGAVAAWLRSTSPAVRS